MNVTPPINSTLLVDTGYAASDTTLDAVVVLVRLEPGGDVPSLFLPRRVFEVQGAGAP
jgi:hypothetical protein